MKRAAVTYHRLQEDVYIDPAPFQLVERTSLYKVHIAMEQKWYSALGIACSLPPALIRELVQLRMPSPRLDSGRSFFLAFEVRTV